MTYAWEGPSDEEREKLQDAELEFAKLYLVFELDERARALFQHWDDVYARKQTPVNATINEYVANETMRVFLQKIREQIKLAHSRK
jgi:hypothetical protein